MKNTDSRWNGRDLWCSERVGSSCLLQYTRCIAIVIFGSSQIRLGGNESTTSDQFPLG